MEERRESEGKAMKEFMNVMGKKVIEN